MDADLVLVGGGLANSLIAYRLSQVLPDLETLLLERGSRLGGEHTWSFNTADLTAAQHDWMAPFVEHRWPGYEVRFPAYRRWIDSGYCTITSPRLHDVVSDTLGERVLTDCDVTAVAPHEVTMSDGRSLTASAVIDGRGPTDAGGVGQGCAAELEDDHVGLRRCECGRPGAGIDNAILPIPGLAVRESSWGYERTSGVEVRS